MISKAKQSLMQDLVTRFQGGDGESFVELWERVNGYVYHLMKQGVDEATARDLSSMVCARLYDGRLNRYKIRPGFSFITWLHNLSLRIKIDELRKRMPESGIAPEAAEKQGICDKITVSQATAEMAKNPLDILVGKENQAIRTKALGLLPNLMKKLSAVEQYVLWAGACEGRTDKEIALELSGDEQYAARYQKMRERALIKVGQMLKRHGIADYPD